MAIVAAGCGGVPSASEPTPREQLAWLVSRAADGISPKDAASRLSPAFRAAVPLERLNRIVRALDDAGAPRVAQFIPVGADGAVALITTGARRVRADIIVESRAPRRIVSFRLLPADRVSLRSLSDVPRRLGALGSRSSTLVASVDAGRCRPIVDAAADVPQPVGSIAKLYVLGATSTAVERGALAWREVLPSPEPNATYPMEPELGGTGARSVADAAAAMIGESNNAATDTLIARVGRTGVENDLARLGMAAPARNRPFLTTREFFLLKLDSDLAGRFERGAERARRRVLDQISTRSLPPIASVADALTRPRRPFDVEWFASANDICRAHLALQARSGGVRSRLLRGILAANPGTALDRTAWPYVAFKGGSEAGVSAVSWYLERADGRRFVVVLTVVDANRRADSQALLALGGSVIDHLATWPRRSPG